MTSSRDSELQALIDREEEARKARIARAVEQGGLPDEEDLAALRGALDDVFSQAEMLDLSVKGISEADDADELPFKITLEQIGLVAVIAEEISGRAGELQDFAGKIRSRIWHLETLRSESKAASDA